MGGKEGGGEFTGHKSAEACASKGPAYTSGAQTACASDETTLGAEKEGGTGRHAWPESSMTLNRNGRREIRVEVPAPG